MRASFLITAAVLSLAAAPAAALQLVDRVSAPTWQADAFFNHTSGTYGTDERTDATYVGVTGARLFPRGRLSVTIPHVSITGRGEVTFVSGGPNKRGRGTVVSGAPERTESGLGDIIFRGAYVLAPEAGERPEFGASAFVKTPTADDKKGLGTGEFDEGVAVDAYKTLPNRYFGMAEIGYVFIGDPPDTNYNDKWTVSLGGGRLFQKGISVYGFYDEERALVEGEANPRTLTVGLRIAPRPAVSFGVALMLGLSDGAPDAGVSLSGRIKFR